MTVTTRERLSLEAAKQFAQNGYHGTSIGDLARALGIRKASVYSHIAGKEELLAELTSAGADAFARALDDVPDDVAPVERLRLALHAHLRVVYDQLDVATVWLLEWRYLTGEARDRFVAERRRYERRVEGLFRDAVRAGELNPDLDTRHATLLFLSVGNWAYTWMTHRTRVADRADRLWRLMLAGLR